jgi:hypothetical protein
MGFSLFRRSAVSTAMGLGTSLVPDTEVDALPSDALPALPPDVCGFVAYSWLLDPKKQIIGYHLRWRPGRFRPGDAATQLQALVTTVAQAFVDRREGWAMGKLGLLLDVTPATVAGLAWNGIPARNVVLCWSTQDFADGGARQLVQELRAQGFGHLVRGELPRDPELRQLVTHRDVGAGDPALVAACRDPLARSYWPLATSMPEWATYDACSAQRVPVLVPPSRTPPATAAAGAALQPSTLLIVKLLQMLQANEHVRVIEAALKHDAAITYRLLRHINSPAFGLGVKIDSLRRAVSMFGYSRLFRWLSMLLAAPNTRPGAPYLMKKAIARGRLVELAGEPLVGAHHSDNLFLVGMFSVLDQLMGVPMPELLEHVQLADTVRQAIVQHDGIYGPFLALAVACERGDDNLEALADHVCMTSQQVNAAHLAAISWSHEVARAQDEA